MDTNAVIAIAIVVVVVLALVVISRFGGSFGFNALGIFKTEVEANEQPNIIHASNDSEVVKNKQRARDGRGNLIKSNKSKVTGNEQVNE